MLLYKIKQQHRKVILIIMAIASVTIYSMISVAPAFADDVTPPPTEEPIVLPPTDLPADVVLVATTPTEVPAVVLSPIDESTDAVLNNDLTLNPDNLLQIQTTETSVSAAPGQTSLDLIPEGTAIVVMVNGQVEPLATQDAANAILTDDPMWCPSGKLPGDFGCTSNYPNVTTLISNLGVMSGPGTIYFTPVYSSNDVVFNHSNVNLSNLGALTIQGGWNGLYNGFGYAISGVTNFNAPITINWDNTTVTINDIIITGATGTGLTVTSSGDIVLNNVQANGNSVYGAFLDNSAGTGNVTLTGTNTFNDNGSDGLHVVAKGAIDIGNLTTGNDLSDGNGGNGTSLDNSAGNSDVNLSGTGIFNGNAGNGLQIITNGAISLANITASSNVSGYGAYLSALGAGSSVTLNGTNIFNHNGLDGLYVNAIGNIFVANATANFNGANGLSLQSSANITVDYCANAANNGGYGVHANLPGLFVLNKGDFSGNGLDEYQVIGGGIQNVKNCLPLSEKPPLNPNKITNKPTHEINLTSKQIVTLECTIFNGTMLILPNGDSAYLPCPIGDKASLAALTQADLKNALPKGTVFTSGFNLQVETEASVFSFGSEVPTTASAAMTISFVIPNGQSGADMALLFWNGSEWTEIKSTTIVNGCLTAQVDFDGLFIMVSK